MQLREIRVWGSGKLNCKINVSHKTKQIYFSLCGTSSFGIFINSQTPHMQSSADSACDQLLYMHRSYKFLDGYLWYSGYRKGHKSRSSTQILCSNVTQQWKKILKKDVAFVALFHVYQRMINDLHDCMIFNFPRC